MIGRYNNGNEHFATQHQKNWEEHNIILTAMKISDLQFDQNLSLYKTVVRWFVLGAKVASCKSFL